MTSKRASGESSMLPARRVPAVSDGAMRDWAEALVARAREEGVELTGEGGLLTGLVQQVLQTGLEVELADHLGYEAHDPVGRGSGNSRNGSYPKSVVTEIGDVELRMPRDRNGSFRAGHGPQAHTPARWPCGQRGLPLREGPHHG